MADHRLEHRRIGPPERGGECFAGTSMGARANSKTARRMPSTGTVRVRRTCPRNWCIVRHAKFVSLLNMHCDERRSGPRAPRTRQRIVREIRRLTCGLNPTVMRSSASHARDYSKSTAGTGARLGYRGHRCTSTACGARASCRQKSNACSPPSDATGIFVVAFWQQVPCRCTHAAPPVRVTERCKCPNGMCLRGRTGNRRNSSPRPVPNMQQLFTCGL